MLWLSFEGRGRGRGLRWVRGGGRKEVER